MHQFCIYTRASYSDFWGVLRIGDHFSETGFFVLFNENYLLRKKYCYIYSNLIRHNSPKSASHRNAATEYIVHNPEFEISQYTVNRSLIEQ